MHDFLFDLYSAEVFQDNISVGSESFEDLMRDLEILFQHLDKYNFKLQAKKCSIGISGWNYLGLSLFITAFTLIKVR